MVQWGFGRNTGSPAHEARTRRRLLRMTKNSSNSLERPLSPLAADIEAEFGHLRPEVLTGPRLSAAQAHALRLSIDEVSRTVPKQLRSNFHRSCLERLKNHFGIEYRNLASSQFREAVAIVSAHIEEARKKVDKMSIEIPKTDSRRWKVTFFNGRAPEDEVHDAC